MTTINTAPEWKRLLDHVKSVPERIYEHWQNSGGWDNLTVFGKEYGEDGVAWCVIFDWDMFHDMGLDSIVPKTDSVSSMTTWAVKNGQWSQYPSVGAWVNFGNGAHTEIVVGFDADNVYTKGGNSLESGAVDNGQGNGVWSHSHARRDSYVTGYFAPRFPDGVCPPTADPADPRHGTAVTSYTWPGPSNPTPPPTRVPSVSLSNVVAAARHDPAAPQGSALHHDDVLVVERALNAEGLLASQWVDGSYGSKTIIAYSALQQRYGYTGTQPGGGADGIPGLASLTRLGTAHNFTVRA